MPYFIASCANPRDSPMLAFPNNLCDLVDDEGGGGFWICDAVGARDWRIE